MSDTMSDRIFLPANARPDSERLAQWLDALPIHTGPTPQVAPVPSPPELTPEFVHLAAHLLRDLAQGRTVTVGALPDELTTTVAAEQAGVSRATLMKWIGEGRLPAHKVGSHTRVKTADLMALRKARAAEQRQALENLLALEDEFEIQ